MQDSQPARGLTKRSVNLSIDAKLVAAAKADGINLSATLEAVLLEKQKEKQQDVWRKANQNAVDESNAQVERDGLWYDAFRPW